ncbi:MAG: triose-phosphate isomerase, partial [Candidatus Eremiobacteraeota bacterium]|nr:triose-phosphate isomerase [Candidatus Eremiobacteraeota bacterium]
MKRPLIVGNWKMHKTVSETIAFARELRERALPLDAVDAVVCPPFTALCAARDALSGTRIGLGAQNVCWADSGAYTGEVAPRMLVDCGVRWVVVGHSERRAMFGELDERVNEKVRAALANGITPIVAVGETGAERAAGQTREKVMRQVRAAFAGVPDAEVRRCVVAYEPIWAIGTGNPCSPEDADEVMGEIRGCVAALETAQLLYGGSMTPDNVAAFIARPNV